MKLQSKTTHKVSACIALAVVSMACVAQSWRVTSDDSLGLRKITFTSNCGGLSIFLPSLIQTGDQISGTYFYEPNGTTDQEKARSRDEMTGLLLTVAGIRLDPNERAFHFSAMTRRVHFAITDPHENCADEVSLPIIGLTSFIPEKKFLVPLSAKLGNPIVIRGEFDGDLRNTTCSMDDKPLEILAESPRQIVVRAPRVAIGGHFIQVADKGKSTKVSITVEPNLSAPSIIQ